MPAGGIIGVLQNLLLNAVSNPVEVRIGTNLIAFLNWARPSAWASSGGTLLGQGRRLRVIVGNAPFIALLPCIVSALAACGVSGIAAGSLLLIPMACKLLVTSTGVLFASPLARRRTTRSWCR